MQGLSALSGTQDANVHAQTRPSVTLQPVSQFSYNFWAAAPQDEGAGPPRRRRRRRKETKRPRSQQPHLDTQAQYNATVDASIPPPPHPPFFIFLKPQTGCDCPACPAACFLQSSAAGRWQDGVLQIVPRPTAGFPLHEPTRTSRTPSVQKST